MCLVSKPLVVGDSSECLHIFFPFRHVTFENLSYLSFPLDYLLYFLQFRHNTFQNLLCLAFPLSYLPFFFSFDTLHSKTSHVRRFLSLPHLFLPAST